MRLNIHIFLCGMIFLITQPGKAQLGISQGSMQNPPGIHWQKISTLHFNIVFPAEIAGDANGVANTLEHLYEADGYSLKTIPRNISLVLHNRNTEANGFVQLAPRQSEWFNTPPQVGLIGVNPWYRLLAVHEYRHVVQFDRTLCGLTKWLYYLFGDYGHAAGAFFSLPSWVWEGDAVLMETLLTSGGRGRMPEFTMPIRAMLLSGKRHSYYKMIFGSYRNWSANPYPFGYLMAAYLRRQKGTFIWSDVMTSTMALSLLPYRFSWSLRRQTGHALGYTYGAAMDELKTIWQEQLQGVALTEARQLNRTDRFLTHYLYPKPLQDGSVLVLKYGLADRFSFVRLQPDGAEKRIINIGATYLDPPSVQAGKIVWNERLPHPRWGYLDYSSIKMYDMDSQRQTRLSSKSKWLAPALSHDGRQIAVVEYTPANRCQLVLIDSKNGEESKRLPNPDNAFIMTPSWSADNRLLVFNSLTKQGRSLCTVDVETGQWQPLIDYGDQNTGLPVFFNDFILFNWDYSGIDNIYAIHQTSKEIWQVTSRPFGAFHPAVSADGRTLFFNDYTIQGYQVSRMTLDSSKWVKLAEVPHRPFRFHEPLIEQEPGVGLCKSIPNQSQKVENYHALKDAIRVHSWIPPLTTDEHENISAQIYSQNLLGTLGWGLDYTFNQNENSNAYGTSISYAGWYPIIDFQARYGERTSSYIDRSNQRNFYSWQEKGASLGLRLPLNLTRSVYQTQLEIGIYAEAIDLSGKTVSTINKQNNGLFTPVSGYLYFFRGYQWMNEMYPRWGQSLYIIERQVPFHSDYQGRLFSAQANVYFPGLARNHGWRMQLAMEKQQPEQYRFENEVRFCRGYSYEFHKQFWRCSADYGMPLLYPDWNLLGLLYVKRMQANGFYDETRARDENRKSRYRACGVELMANLYLFSMPLELPMGVRFIYRITEKEWCTEFLMSIGL